MYDQEPKLPRFTFYNLFIKHFPKLTFLKAKSTQKIQYTFPIFLDEMFWYYNYLVQQSIKCGKLNLLPLLPSATAFTNDFTVLLHNELLFYVFAVYD